jgi:hypothetical protein
MRMPWGKFRDRPVAEVPASYLLWCLEKCENLPPRLETAIRGELGRRFASGPTGGPAASGGPAPCPKCSRVEQAVMAWFRRTAMEHHPDRGGDHRVMVAINNLKDELLEAIRC